MSPTITSRVEGFRRCGVAHPRAATEYPAGFFTPEQLEILQNEPMLTVIVTEGNDIPPRPNVKAVVEALKAAQTLEEFDKLLEGEDRDSVLKASANLRKKLEQP